MLDTLIEATAGYYNLPRELVCEILSETVSDYYSEIFQKKVICTVTDGELDTYISGTLTDRRIKLNVTQSDISAIIKRYRTILSNSESSRRLFQYSRYRRTVIEGVVGESDTVQILGVEGVIGMCCKRDMGIPLLKGEKAYFYVKSVDISAEESLNRCVFYLSRTARELPVKLLESIVNNPSLKLRCYKRVQGKISLIYTNYYMKKTYARQLTEMLSERVIFRKFSL